MVANPNSNLVFDFPDPSPRFEFGDGFGGGPSSSSSSPTKKGNKRFGKFGKNTKNTKVNVIGGNNHGNTSSNNYDSPSKQSVDSSSGTATTTSLNSSLNSSYGSYANNNNSPLKSRNNSGDIAAGPPSNTTNNNNNTYVPHFEISQSSPKFTLSNNNKTPRSSSNSPGQSQSSISKQQHHARHPSNNSTSGYISEVSEFSFDRVTVTTNETGHTSNVSWSFLDDTLINAVGGGQDKGGNAGGRSMPFVPYTGDGPTNMAMADTAMVRNSSPGRNRNSMANNNSSSHHRPNISNSTFSNVSLSSEDTDNIHFTGVVNDSAQSVISEISERTGGALEGTMGGTNDAVKALLRDGMESARQKHSSNQETPERRTIGNKAKGLSMIKEASGGDSSPSRNTHSTAKSTVSEKSKSFLEDIQTTYTNFKTKRNNGQKENKNSILQSIVEDVQFCGLYFCGIDTTTDNGDSSINGDVDKYDEKMKKKKEERKREAEDTFLGKVVRCGNCGDGSAFCVSL